MATYHHQPFGCKHAATRSRLDHIGTLGLRRRYRRGRPFTVHIYRRMRIELGAA
jgi:hypothetical protein